MSYVAFLDDWMLFTPLASCAVGLIATFAIVSLVCGIRPAVVARRVGVCLLVVLMPTSILLCIGTGIFTALQFGISKGWGVLGGLAAAFVTPFIVASVNMPRRYRPAH